MSVLALFIPTLVLTSCGGTTVSIRYVLNDGELVGAPESYNTASAPDFSKIVPTRENYAFGGWYTDKKLTQPFSAKDVVGDSVTLYAKWTGETFKINYELDGGTLENPLESYIYGERTVIGTLTPQKENCVFVGWYSNSSFTKRISIIDAESTGDITLYAKFNPSPVKLSEIPDIRRGLVELGFSTVTVSLADYVNTNGTQLAYTAESSNSSVTATVSGNTLTVKFLSAVCDSTVTVKASYGDKELLSFEFSASAVKYTKIVCVGDSLTESSPVYPTYLKNALAPYGIEVINCGRSGAAASEYSNNLSYGSYKEYAKEKYEASLAVEGADCVIIMLGTNDNTRFENNATRYDWSVVAPAYKAAYLSLIEDYRAAYPGVDIVVMSSPEVLDTNTLLISNDIMETYTYPLQKEIAASAGARFIDLRDYLRSFNNAQDFYRDGVHFTELGAEKVADFVLKSL